jgi:hypothetical protein
LRRANNTSWSAASRSIAAAAIRGTSIADLSTVNARLTLAIGCVTAGSALIAGLLACGAALGVAELLAGLRDAIEAAAASS